MVLRAPVRVLNLFVRRSLEDGGPALFLIGAHRVGLVLGCGGSVQARLVVCLGCEMVGGGE